MRNYYSPILFPTLFSKLNRVEIKMLLTLVGFMFFSYLSVAQYCVPEIKNNYRELSISNVSYGLVNNSSTHSNDAINYRDYTAFSSFYNPSDIVYINMDIHSNVNYEQVAVKVFLDINNDDVFDEPSERVYSAGPSIFNSTNFNFTLPASISPGSHRMRIMIINSNTISPCIISYDLGETEDYNITVGSPPLPLANDDTLDVAYNSVSSPANSVNVSVNDFIGTTNGGDLDNFSLSVMPLTTANGGTVVEGADGNFVYVPATGFIGLDSFDYQICDTANNCDTGTVNVYVNSGACVPTSNSNERTGNEVHYITRVQVSGESQNIDNPTGDDGGYGNYISVPPADMIPGNSYTIDLEVSNTGSNNSGWAAYIDYNNNGSFNDVGDNIYATNGTGGTEAVPYVVRTITIPTSATTGRRVLRIGSRRYWASVQSCGNDSGNSEEFEDYVIDILPIAGANISLSGNAVAISHNSTTTSLADGTNFGVVDSNIGEDDHTFVITNNGSTDLTLGLIGPVNFGIGSHSSFTLLNTPAPGTIISSGASTTFQVRYTPRTVGQHNATIEIASDDTNENPFVFAIQGEGAQIYPDSDGDGVPDNVDVDDDNDGIRDIDEQNACLMSPLSTTADVIFLNETFGAGLNRVTIDGSTPGVTTDYCYEDGTIVQGPDECDTEVNLGDGNYTVHYSISDNNGVTDIGPSNPDVSNWAEGVWYYGEDHTTGDVNGRMAIFNADVDPGVFYETEIVGTVPGAPIFYEFWALNIDRQDSDFSAGELPRILPNVTVNFFNSDKSSLLATYNPGDVERCTDGSHNGCGSLSQWIQFNTTITLADSDFIIQMVNNSPGGLGNDLALDDIKITQTLCDLDGDGVADVIDLDNDNDGIPNIYEIGQPMALSTVDTNLDGTTFGDATWVDLNNDGLHDAYDTYSPDDSDGDSVPDYLDLDSDNDGIFDVLEYDGLGDLDVNGDGIGEGIDNTTGISDDQFDGDGLLSGIDNNDDDTDDIDHGTSSFVLPLDTDNDGIPDYLDIDSDDATNDLSDGSDIDNSYYADQDLDNDGRVDDTGDVDRDGINDGNNDFDTGIYGAPIDLDDDLSIYFDGRNDYLQTAVPVTAGLNSSSMMVWVLADHTASDAVIMGEDNFNIVLNPSGNVILSAVDSGGNNFSITSTNTISDIKWMHIAASYDSVNMTLYINGVEEGVIGTSGLPLSSLSGNSFTVGNSSIAGSSNYYRGYLDEIRVFNSAQDINDLRRIMYQEIEANGSYVTGVVLPKDTSILWNELAIYYDFTRIEGDIVYDVTNNMDIKMYNVKEIVLQTAPIPYVTIQDGLLSSNNTFVQNTVWEASDLFNYDYTILRINHETVLDNSISTIGIVLETSGSIDVNDGNYIENSWYVLLEGNIDLEGDAQLIQTISSDLDVTSNGFITRKQQGEANVYSYNYWSSPVGEINSTTNNNSFQLSNLEDNVGPVQFTGINVGTPPVTSPVTISGRWLHTFLNGATYSDWSRIDPSVTQIAAGHGWSQKGTGNVLGYQEYLFKGKPNNGLISIPATPHISGNITSSLLGNPYPSAFDAREFIDDNAGVIDGAVYLWDQFRGTNHQLAYYEGGYATITKMTTVKAAQYAGLGYLNGGAGPAILPTFFLPVSQAFFVTITNNGSIEFNNSQRVFKQEALNESIFLAAPGSNQATVDRSSYQDLSIKLIRLELISDTGASRQIAIGFDSGLSDGYDYGYDAYLTGTLNETDFFVSSQGQQFVIKSFNDITDDKVVNLAVKGITGNLYKITSTDFTNIDLTQEVWLKDNELNVYHDIRTSDYHFYFSIDGLDEDRFDIVFYNPTTLSNSSQEIDDLLVYYDNDSSIISIQGLNQSLTGLDIYDLSGKLISSFRESELINEQSGIKVPQISTGIYLVTLSTNDSNRTVKLAVQ
nr:GEVED domain-containing protein [Nonlabens ulvanivorans]